MNLIEQFKSFAGMILLIIGKSGVGKSTLIKNLISNNFKRAFKVLDGVKSTTPVLMHYTFKKHIESVKVGILLKPKEKLKIMFKENLLSALEKLMSQYISGKPKNMSPGQEKAYVLDLLDKVATKDYSKFFNIEKLLISNKDEFVNRIYNKIYLPMEFLFNSKMETDNVKGSKGDFKHQISSFFKVNDIINKDIDDIFDWLYSLAINNILDGGFKQIPTNDEGEYFEGIFGDESSLKNALVTINNSNKNMSSSDKISSICMVEEIFLEVPMNTDYSNLPDEFAITDSYGLTHNGNKKINENLEAILLGQAYNTIVLLKEYSDEDGIDDILAHLMNSAHKCNIIPVLTKIADVLNNYDDDDLDDSYINKIIQEYVPVEQESFKNQIRSSIQDTISFKLDSSFACDVKRRSAYLPSSYSMDKVVANVVSRAYLTFKSEQISIKLLAKSDEIKHNQQYENFLIFGVSIENFADQIKLNLNSGIVKDYKCLAANSELYHGNTVNALVGHWVNGYGHSSNAQVYCDIYSNPFRDIRDSIICLLDKFDIKLNSDYISCSNKKDEQQLIASCKVFFATQLYNGITKVLAYDNLSSKTSIQNNNDRIKLNQLWWYDKHTKLNALLGYIQELCCEENLDTLNNVIIDALKNASIITMTVNSVIWE